MDNLVPPSAAVILEFIRRIEVGRDDRAGYDVIYGNKQHKLKTPLTRMTLDEVLEAQRTWSKNHGSSAAGGYQFMRRTLLDLMQELGLKGSQKLDPDLQDRLAFHLLKRRGFQAFLAGKITMVEFGNRLAMEWASLPVLITTQGGKRRVHRGESFYAGDGLNKSLIAPEAVEAVLMKALALAKPADPPRTVQPTVPLPTPDPDPAAGAKLGILALIIAGLLAAGAWVAGKFCGLTSLLCGG